MIIYRRERVGKLLCDCISELCLCSKQFLLRSSILNILSAWGQVCGVCHAAVEAVLQADDLSLGRLAEFPGLWENILPQLREDSLFMSSCNHSSCGLGALFLWLSLISSLVKWEKGRWGIRKNLRGGLNSTRQSNKPQGMSPRKGCKRC